MMLHTAPPERSRIDIPRRTSSGAFPELRRRYAAAVENSEHEDTKVKSICEWKML